jgi:hypothetical protein
MHAPSLALRLPALLALLLFAAAPVGAATYTWKNASGGSWSTAANWTPSGVPSSGDAAVLPTLAGAYSVALDVSPTVDALDLAPGATLDAGSEALGGIGLVSNAGTVLNLRGAFDDEQFRNLAGGLVEIAAGDLLVPGDSLVNDGTIVVPATSTFYLVGRTAIEGGGTIVLHAGGKILPNVELPAYTHWLTHYENHTITGAGFIGVPMKNRGRIVQDGTYGSVLQLRIWVDNYGSIEVRNGAKISMFTKLRQLGGRVIGHGRFAMDYFPYPGLGQIDNWYGGSFVAEGGDLALESATILEGRFQSADGSKILLDGYWDPQNMTVDAGTEVIVSGAMDFQIHQSVWTNHGIIRLRGSMKTSGFDWVNVSFGGTGTVILENGAFVGAGMLTNLEGHTITGCGAVGVPIDNYGTFDVDCPEARTALINGRTFRNRNVFRLSRGTLLLHSTKVATLRPLDVSGGSLRVGNGATLYLQGDAGKLVAGPGGVEFGRGNTAVTIQGGVLESVGKGTFTNLGTTTLSDVTIAPEARLSTRSGATTRVTGRGVRVRGVDEIEAGGSLVVDAASPYRQEGGHLVLAGGTFTAPGGLRVTGLLEGAGRIAASVVNDGTIRPAAGAALSIDGDFAQSAGARLEVPLAGDDAAAIGRLAVAGTATLAGTIGAFAADGFVPATGQEFPVLAFGARAGTFDEVAANFAGTLEPTYGAELLTLATRSTVGVPDPRALPTVVRFAPRGNAFVLELPEAAEVEAALYDVRGRAIGTLAAGAHPAGVHTLPLPGGASLSSGIYFARVKLLVGAREDVRTARLALVH